MISTGLRSILVACDLSDGAAAAKVPRRARVRASPVAVHGPVPGGRNAVADVHMFPRVLGEMEEALSAQLESAVPAAVRGSSSMCPGRARCAVLLIPPALLGGDAAVETQEALATV